MAGENERGTLPPSDVNKQWRQERTKVTTSTTIVDHKKTWLKHHERRTRPTMTARTETSDDTEAALYLSIIVSHPHGAFCRNPKTIHKLYSIRSSRRGLGPYESQVSQCWRPKLWWERWGKKRNIDQPTSSTGRAPAAKKVHPNISKVFIVNIRTIVRARTESSTKNLF